MRPERFAPLSAEEAHFLLGEVEAFEPHWRLVLAYVPGACRPAWLSVMAFAAEIVSVPGRVSNGMLGQIRLQWWREVLGEVFGTGPVRRHPVAEALALTIQDEPSASGLLAAMIDGMDVFLAAGEDRTVAEALHVRRPVYGSLAELLGNLAGTESGGGALVLHALLRSYPDRTRVPKEDGVEDPRNRFCRALAQHPKLSSELAAAVQAVRQEVSQSEALPLPALPLALARPVQGSAELLDHPFTARLALFKAVLRGRL